MTTPLPHWSLLSPGIPLGALAGHSVAVVADVRDTPQMIQVKRHTPKSNVVKDTVTVTYGPIGDTDPPGRVKVPSWRRLDDFVDEQLGSQVDRAIVVPGVMWSERGHVTPRVSRAWLLTLAAVALALSSAIAVAIGVWWVLPLALGPLLALVTTATHRRTRTAIRVAREPQGTRTFTESEIHARLAPPGPPAGEPTPTDEAFARVNGVKDHYGRLRGDIVYRIENSALFDSSVPTTHRFLLDLLKWDDDADHLDRDDRGRLSYEVLLSFRTARDYAERVGLAHLPTQAQPAGSRALKVAALAAHPATAGEREAALAQLGGLLDDLALHYLPSAHDLPRMLASQRAQLDAAS
ncbi:hypothetical protein [Tessaracoccus sp. G1721]